MCGFREKWQNWIHIVFLQCVFPVSVNSTLFGFLWVMWMGKLTSILGCGTSSLPLKYLGLLLGASYKAKSIWNVIVEKMERQLAS
jgi:uncharacterized membrane protein YdjX (TVP38/TMEM64 family)